MVNASPQLTPGYPTLKEGDWKTLSFILNRMQIHLNALGGDRGQYKHKNRQVLVGLESTEDLIIDAGTQGVVLKDTQARPHYWRLTISTIGALVITDLGVTKP